MKSAYHISKWSLMFFTAALFATATVYVFRAYYQNVSYFAFMGVLFFIAGILFAIITAVYPFLYWGELVVEEIEEEKFNKKK